MVNLWLPWLQGHGNSKRILRQMLMVKLLDIINVNSQKKFHRIMNVHENDARASSWAFSFFLSGPWTADVFSRA